MIFSFLIGLALNWLGPVVQPFSHRDKITSI